MQKKILFLILFSLFNISLNGTTRYNRSLLAVRQLLIDVCRNVDFSERISLQRACQLMGDMGFDNVSFLELYKRWQSLRSGVIKKETSHNEFIQKFLENIKSDDFPDSFTLKQIISLALRKEIHYRAVLNGCDLRDCKDYDGSSTYYDTVIPCLVDLNIKRKWSSPLNGVNNDPLVKSISPAGVAGIKGHHRFGEYLNNHKCLTREVDQYGRTLLMQCATQLFPFYRESDELQSSLDKGVITNMEHLIKKSDEEFLNASDRSDCMILDHLVNTMVEQAHSVHFTLNSGFKGLLWQVVQNQGTALSPQVANKMGDRLEVSIYSVLEQLQDLPEKPV